MLQSFLFKTQWVLLANPMEILKGRDGNRIFIDTDMISLSLVFRKGGLILCMLAMAFSLLSIILSLNPQSVSEGKKTIISKLFLVFVISSLAAIFGLIKSTFDSAVSLI